MALTLQDLLDNATWALGEQADPRLNLAQIVNSAGRLLFSSHSWRWRERPVATLATVDAQTYAALPSDFGFGEVLDLVMSDGIAYAKPRPATIGEIELMREQSIVVAPLVYWYAVAYPTQTGTTAAPGQPRLELFPVPTATDADVFRLSYRAGWVELSANANTANVPGFMENLLVRLVLAMAADRARGRMPKEMEGFETVGDVLASEEMAHAKRADGAAQTDLGPILGGILGHRGGSDPHLNFGEVTGP